ncbi:helix-turn-helix domain-containing protein [Streptomyces sp. NPDC002779]|uniref:helix-turn-helix domain-containing protein n=1 Tax=Streptomyces sp. NPDC002779 TaxID=3364664 RepID=UPI0036A35381
MQERSASYELVGFLELLARQGSRESIQELAERARAADPDPARLALVEQARDLALEVREEISLYRRRSTGLLMLLDTTQDLAAPHGLDALLSIIVRRARFLLNLDMSWVALHDEDAGPLVMRASDGHTAMHGAGAEVLAAGIGALAVAHEGPAWTDDYLNDPRFPRAAGAEGAVRAEDLRAVLAVPMRNGGASLGVLYGGQRRVRQFTPDEIALMSSLADLAVVVTEKTRLAHLAHRRLEEITLRASQSDAQVAAARRMDVAYGRLIDLVLQGGSLNALADAAGELLGGTVQVRDPAGAGLTSGASPGLVPAEFRRIARKMRPGRTPVEVAEDTWACSVAAGEELLGYLVLGAASPPDQWTSQLLAKAAKVVALAVLLQRNTSLLAGRTHSDLLHDLLHGEQMSPQQLEARIDRFAADLSRPHVLVVARLEPGSSDRAAIWASTYARERAGVASVGEDSIALLLTGADPAAAGRAVAIQLSAILGHPATVGSAGPVSHARDLPAMYQEAHRCAETLIALDSAGAASARELGFLGLMLSHRPDIAAFVQDTIGPLLDYDVQQGTELARTLEVYFAHGNSPTRAASTLHVHPNTVTRRLERVTGLLGERWQEPKQLLEVQLALRLHRVRHTVTTARRTAPTRRH